ncbi:MAG: hypothetical protein JWM35_2238 [Verrucomicrobia bacterium]|nr:hypothetical protein [Verrucomicrobiota bacterium]
MHSILIVGCGSIGERHLRCFQQTGRAKAFACDSNAALLERLAGSYSVETFADYARGLEAPIDAVVICAPAHLHIPMALQALERGKHVLIEKPLSQSLRQVDDLLDAHRRSGLQAAVAYTMHVFPFLIEAREYLRRGQLGAIRHVVFNSGQPFHKLRPAHAAHYSQTYYRDRKMGGGAIQDALTHTANWLESVLGPTDSVMCDCAHQVLPGVTVEDTVNLSSRHGDVLVSYALNQFQMPNETTLQFNSATGSLRIEFHRQRWGTFFENDTDWSWREAAVPERDSHYINQANRFLDQVESKPSTLCTLEAAAQTLRFNLAALASSESGARVLCSSLVAS